MRIVSKTGQVVQERENITENSSLRVKTSYVYSIGNYLIKIIEINFELEDKLTKLTDYEMLIDVYSLQSKARKSLPVEIKTSGRSESSMKSSAIVCSKCFFLNSDNDYRNFAWWLQLNRMIGYKKVSFCENAIRLEYFREQADLIETQTLKCIPNFISRNNKNKYFTSLTDLKYNGVFSYASTDVFNVIITNDCYLRNLDKLIFWIFFQDLPQ